MAYRFRGLVHCHYDRKHGVMHADMFMEKDVIILHFEPLSAEEEIV